MAEMVREGKRQLLIVRNEQRYVLGNGRKDIAWNSDKGFKLA